MKQSIKKLSLTYSLSISIYILCVGTLLTSCGEEIAPVSPTHFEPSGITLNAPTDTDTDPPERTPRSSSDTAALPDTQHAHDTITLATMAGENIDMNVPHETTIQGLYKLIERMDLTKDRPEFNLAVGGMILPQDDNRIVLDLLKTQSVPLITIIFIQEKIRELTKYYIGPKEWEEFPIIAPYSTVTLNKSMIPPIDEKMIEEAKRLKAKKESFLVFLHPGYNIDWLEQRTRITDIPEKLKSIFSDIQAERIYYEIQQPRWVLVPFNVPCKAAPYSNIGYTPGTPRDLIYATVLSYIIHKKELFHTFFNYRYQYYDEVESLLMVAYDERKLIDRLWFDPVYVIDILY